MEKKTQLSHYNEDSVPDGKEFKIGIVRAEWNHEITEPLEIAARETIIKHGVEEENITMIIVPGTYELPMGARILMGKQSYDAIICLGCVIEGETRHNEYINNAVAHTLQQLSLTSNTPCIYGVVTTHNMEQAQARSGGNHGNKGVDAAVAALKMAYLARKTKKSSNQIGFSR